MFGMNNKVIWNPSVKIVIADVDETIADVYTPAEPAMISALTDFLQSGRVLFMVSGGSLKRITNDIVDFLPKELRHQIIICHCSGAEVWGFDVQGKLLKAPYYSVYEEKFDNNLKHKWRKIVKDLITEFKFNIYPPEPKINFRKAHSHPLNIMYDDRGPQITFELVNATDLSDKQLKEMDLEVPVTHGSRDLRIPLLERADELFIKNNIPASPRLGGMFAVDLAVKGVSKATAIDYVFNNARILNNLGLNKAILSDPNIIEIWGDKFSSIRGGTDRHMCEAVDKRVRAIDFRQEDPDEFLDGYNIVLWNGDKNLHFGLLEYLKTIPNY